MAPRMNQAFYKAIDELRSKYGETEYDRDQIIPAVMGLLREHQVDDADLMRDAANAILDKIEKQEDASKQSDFFPYDKQVALGERHRIRRGRLNTEQLYRRKRVIDVNKMGQDRAWANETDWLGNALDALRGHDLSTTVQDVLPETPVVEPKAAHGPRPRA